LQWPPGRNTKQTTIHETETSLGSKTCFVEVPWIHDLIFVIDTFLAKNSSKTGSMPRRAFAGRGNNPAFDAENSRNDFCPFCIKVFFLLGGFWPKQTFPCLQLQFAAKQGTHQKFKLLVVTENTLTQKCFSFDDKSQAKARVQMLAWQISCCFCHPSIRNCPFLLLQLMSSEQKHQAVSILFFPMVDHRKCPSSFFSIVWQLDHGHCVAFHDTMKLLCFDEMRWTA
jgi:hypothetical protein